MHVQATLKVAWTCILYILIFPNMRNLLLFLARNSSWFLALLYLLLSLAIVVRNNNYQRSIWFNSSNRAVAWTYSLSGKVGSYFMLQEVNQALAERNAQLESEHVTLRDQIEQLRLAQSDTTYADTRTGVNYDYMPAQVINNSVNQLHNYLTLNRGSLDGVRLDMGVVDADGIVGIVAAVSDHYSVVISLLNTKLRFSCKVKGDDYFGSLTWDGISPRYAKLEELPRHVRFSVGDSIVTSGHSAIFPEGVMVGRVAEQEQNVNDNFYTLKIALSTDFYRLREVRIIRNNFAAEQKEIEERVNIR